MGSSLSDTSYESSQSDEMNVTANSRFFLQRRWDAWRQRRRRRYPALLQISEMDCGAACIAMILRYYGKTVSLNRIRDLANVSRDGTSLFNLATAAEACGLSATAIRATTGHLDQIALPAIAHWKGIHFVVLYQVTSQEVVIADPATGLVRLTVQQFAEGWTGYLLMLKPTPELAGVEERTPSIARFLPLLRPHRTLLFEVFLAAFLVQLLGLASPVFMQVIVDRVLVHQNVGMLNVMLIGMLLVAVFQAATTALRQYLMLHTARRIDLEMVTAFYRHLLALPIRYFEDRRVGDILKRFGENEKIRELLTGRAVSVALDCLMIVIYVGVMFFYNTKLALAALAFMPAYGALTLLVTPIMKRQSRESFQRSAEAESHLVESVTAIGTVKAGSVERRTRWKWEGLMLKALQVEFRGAITNISAQSIATVLQALNTTVLLWYGAHLVIGRELSVGQLMAFHALAANVTRPIISLIDLWHDVQEVNIALERLSDVFDATPEEDHARGHLVQLPPIVGHITFERVTFRYTAGAEREALHGINLTIHPGQRVALVGPSGAGKTTMGNLLLRFHDPTEGRILIDGFDLRHVSPSSLRPQIGVVPQDVFLFAGTIRENIALSAPDAPLTEVIAAATLAGAHDFVSHLPLGYETVIGERGQGLSGGQRQRIAIARALFGNPCLLILDEATSALDTDSERAIQDSLNRMLKDRTTLIIAHRLSTVRDADLIVVLDQGRIVESGGHDELLRNGGLYASLVSRQLEGLAA
jgi:ATP-binding cassette subfamily B protein